MSQTITQTATTTPILRKTEKRSEKELGRDHPSAVIKCSEDKPNGTICSPPQPQNGITTEKHLTNGHAAAATNGHVIAKATKKNAAGADDGKPWDEFGFGTLAVQAGQRPDRWNMKQVVPLISLSTTYAQPAPNEPFGYEYGRSGNPTRDCLEEALAALEKASYCALYASGMSAVVAIAQTLLRTGDHIVSTDNVYGGTQRYFRKFGVERHGLEDFSLCDLTDLDALRASLRSTTRLVWFESPTNPLLKVVDIAGAVRVCREYNPRIVVVVDNTFMSPYFQRPLELGADVVLQSLTKYINGHSDVLMGAVLTNDETIGEALKFTQRAVGAVPSAFDTYLVNRGLKTLHVRMRQHEENGFAVARFLEADPRVERVLFPGLPSHPQYEVHRRQASGSSGMCSFYVRGGLAEAKAFLSALKLFILAESLGGVQSLAELPSMMTHISVPAEERHQLGITDNLIRLSIGCEDKADLIADLDQALAAADAVYSATNGGQQQKA